MFPFPAHCPAAVVGHLDPSVAFVTVVKDVERNSIGEVSAAGLLDGHLGCLSSFSSKRQGICVDKHLGRTRDDSPPKDKSQGHRGKFRIEVFRAIQRGVNATFGDYDGRKIPVLMLDQNRYDTLAFWKSILPSVKAAEPFPMPLLDQRKPKSI